MNSMRSEASTPLLERKHEHIVPIHERKEINITDYIEQLSYAEEKRRIAFLSGSNNVNSSVYGLFHNKNLFERNLCKVIFSYAGDVKFKFPEDHLRIN